MMGFSLFMLPAVFLISFILTMVGLGGGLIFSPLFVLMEFPRPTAVSASLFLNGIAAASAALVYFRRKMVDFSISLPLIVTSSLAAPVGALTTHWVNMTVFLTIMAAVLILAGLRMLFSPQDESRQDSESPRKRILGGGFIGLAIGFLAGLLGIGGGVFVVPLLIYLLKVPTKTAAASSVFIVCFSSLTGFITHASMGGVNWPFVLLAALFSFAGGQAGSRVMSGKLKGKTIRIIFGIVLIFMSAKLLHRAFF